MNISKDAADRDSSATRDTDAGVEKMREANENIRKSQGEDSGEPRVTRPTIDRHR